MAGGYLPQTFGQLQWHLNTNLPLNLWASTSVTSMPASDIFLRTSSIESPVRTMSKRPCCYDISTEGRKTANWTVGVGEGRARDQLQCCGGRAADESE